MRILIIRFRQMGDAILATPLLNTLHQSFPDAQIDFVLNAHIAPLFEGHPALHRVIAFTDDERHHALPYVRKVWQTVRRGHYDVIIDMRSTVNTLLFALFSPGSRLRIGIRKPYTRFVFNHRIEGCRTDESMIDHNLRLASPLHLYGPITPCRELTLGIGPDEIARVRQKMAEKGIDFGRPVLLVGVTAKLENKTWPADRMREIVTRLRTHFPQWQYIFNFAPGREAERAQQVYDSLGQPDNIFIHIAAMNPRQLAALAANSTAYFGNEGGARHIVHAMGRPSMVICSPQASKTTWLPTDTQVPAWGIAASDVADTRGLTALEQYDLITTDHVWTMLEAFMRKVFSTL